MNAHSKIERLLVVAPDGTVTLPATVAERAGWTAGMTLDLYAGPAKVSLCTHEDDNNKKTPEEVFARLREINTYRGPRISDEDITEIVAAAAVERYKRTL